MVEELERVRRIAGGTGSTEANAIMEKAMSTIETFKALC